MFFVTAYDGAAHNRLSDVRGRASSGQDRREQNFYNQSYIEGDAYGRPSHYHEDNQYDQSYRDDVPYRSSSSGDNRYETPYSQDVGQGRSYRERDYMERPYREDEMNIAAFTGDGNHDRRYMDKDVPQPYHDEWFPETNPSRGPYKSREGDDYYHGNVSENRFGESGMDYQESRRTQDPMYTSQHGTGLSMDERQRQSRNLPYTEKGRERFQDVDETERHGSYEIEGYNKRERYYSTEDDIPAKKKRKSRFSDASPLEMALAHKR